MTWKNPNGETKKEIVYIFTNKLTTVNNVTVLNILKSCDHRMVRCKVTVNLKRERGNKESKYLNSQREVR